MKCLERLALALLLGTAPSGVAAATAPEARPSLALPEAVRSALPGCACEGDRTALLAKRNRIAEAESIEEAREHALAPTRLARRAVRGARWLAPASEGLRAAAARLAAYEARVAQAATSEAVAAEFGSLVQLASLGPPLLADVDIDVGDDGCNFTTGEIIAIVLGFILGIIPGIILLILLC